MFWNAIRNSMFWYTATALSSAIEDWISEILVISWRASLTSVVHEAYFQEGQLYKICVSEGTQKNLDNPDQRISEVNSPLFFILFYNFIFRFFPTGNKEFLHSVVHFII